jgi:hypothetical protein
LVKLGFLDLRTLHYPKLSHHGLTFNFTNPFAQKEIIIKLNGSIQFPNRLLYCGAEPFFGVLFVLYHILSDGLDGKDYMGLISG